MPALRTVSLLCWLLFTLSAEGCDCEPYGTLTVERDAACGSLAATNDTLAAGNNGSLCFDSCCIELKKKLHALESPLAQTADSQPHWWPWLVTARLLCQCLSPEHTPATASARSHRRAAGGRFAPCSQPRQPSNVQSETAKTLESTSASSYSRSQGNASQPVAGAIGRAGFKGDISWDPIRFPRG